MLGITAFSDACRQFEVPLSIVEQIGTEQTKNATNVIGFFSATQAFTKEMDAKARQDTCVEVLWPSLTKQVRWDVLYRQHNSTHHNTTHYRPA